jgi:DNA-binding transcriptional regulator YiaG
MTNIEFTQAAKKITGFTEKVGYQPVFAFILGVSLDAVKSWASGRRKVPLYIEKLINELQKKTTS